MIYDALEYANSLLATPLNYSVGSVFDNNIDVDRINYPCLLVENTRASHIISGNVGTINTSYNVTLYFLDKTTLDEKVADVTSKLSNLETYIKEFFYVLNRNKAVRSISSITSDVQYKLFDSVSCGWLVTFTIELKDDTSYTCQLPYEL